MLFFMLIKIQMPTTVGNSTFTGRKNFMLNSVEHEESFITSGPDVVYTSVNIKKKKKKHSFIKYNSAS